MDEQRLIDANALKMRRFPNTSNTGGNNSFYYIKKEDVDTAPTIDSIPVVRCKNCKHYEHFTSDHIWPEFDYCSLTGIERGDEDYCSDAERKV